MVRIAHIADVHLGARCSFLGDKAAERENDFLHTFERTIDFCCDPENRIDALVIAGDLFDTHDPASQLVGVVQKNVARAAQTLLVIAVPGTHDAYGYKTCVYRKAPLPGLNVLCSSTLNQPFAQSLRGEKVFFYGMAFIQGVSKNPFASFSLNPQEGIHIGILHGSVGIPSSWEQNSQDLCIAEEDIISSNLDYLALGHFHNFRQKRYGKTLAVYPGSLESKDFTECGERYLVVVDFAEGAPQIEKIPVNSKTVQTIGFNLDDYPCTSSEEVVTTVKRKYGDKKCIANLKVKGSSHTPLDIPYIEQVLSDHFFYITVTDETTLQDSSIIESWKEEKTIRGLFVSRMLEKIALAEGEEKQILEEALKIGVTKFQEG